MMNRGVRGLFFIASATLLVACAAQGPASTKAAPPAKGDAAIAGTKAVPTTGYRKIVKDGVEYFCSRPGYTGSRVDSSVQCLTQAQLDSIRQGAQDLVLRQQNHVGEQSSSANPGGAPYSAVQPLP